MYLPLLLVVLMAASGLANPATRSQDSSPQRDRVAEQTVSGATMSPATMSPATTSGLTTSGGVTIKKLDIVVAPVRTSAEVVTPDPPLETQAAAGVVVADQLVTPARVESEVVPAVGFQTVGVTWPENASVANLGTQVRTRTDDVWTTWTDLEPADGGPDIGTPDADRAARGGTDSLSIGDVDAVQLAFAADAKGGPKGLSLALIGSSAAAPSGSTGGAAIETVAFSTALAAAAAPAPRIITRAEWGAPPQGCTPDVASKLVGAAVHHTAGPNGYSSVEQAMQQIRNDAAFHINGRGWCDIGYNFIVDKWGNIYEGRAKSMTQAVVGAHASGFNSGTVGVSMLGTFDSAPSAATQQSVARIIGWRLRAYHLDPKSSMTYYTEGGDTSRYANQNVNLPRVFGHRDVGLTACPGNGGYGALPNIRTMAHTFAGPLLVSPELSATSVSAGTAVTVRAKSISNLNWRLEVTDTRTGVLVGSAIGYGQESSGGVVANWNGRNTVGGVVGPGPYQLRLTAKDASSGVDVLPWSAKVMVTGSQNPPVVAAVPLVGNLRFVPITPARVLDTRPRAQSIGPNSRVDVIVAGVAGIPADAKAVALNITAANSSNMTNIRAWPAGSARPNASVINADAARKATAAGVILGVGGGRKVSLYNYSGSTHLLADVTGYYTSASGVGSGHGQLPTALRALDTRSSNGPMTSGQRRAVQVTGVGGVPTDARAVVLNVTSIRPVGDGNVNVFPSGGAVPQTSTVNHLPLKDVSNRTTVAVAGGKVDVLLSGASANVVVDVVGWYSPGATARFTPVQPIRAVDTRTGGQTALRAGEDRSFAMATAGLPAGATPASVTIAAIGASATSTYLTAYAAGATRPGTSDLNSGLGRDQANMAIVGLGSGALRIFNAAGTTHVLVDVSGYFK